MGNDINVVLLTVDCLRPDHLGIYGYEPPTSPTIDRLAKNGMVFQNAFTAGPNTPPSFNSLFTSTLPFSGEGYHPLPRSKIPVAYLYGSNGYGTVGINTNDYLKKMFNFNRGFKKYRDLFPERTKFERFVGNKISYLKFRKMEGLALWAGFINDSMMVRDVRPYLPGDSVINELINELDNVDEPFFAWAHFMDTHLPRVPHNDEMDQLGLKRMNRFQMALIKKEIEENKNHSKRFFQKLNQIYDSNIRYIDNQISRLSIYLEEKHPDTILIITADHGEELQEHSHFGHYGKLYDELIHIPLIFHGPKVPTGVREKRMISNIDISPTISSLCDLTTPRAWEGRSIDISSDDSSSGWRDHVFSQVEMKSNKAFGERSGTRITSLRTDRYKLIASLDRKVTALELYDLVSDPEEKINLLDVERDICEEMRSKIQSRVNEQTRLKKDREKLKLKGALFRLKI